MSDSVATALQYYLLYSLQLSFVYILCSFEAWKDEQLAQCLTVSWQGEDEWSNGKRGRESAAGKANTQDVTDSTVRDVLYIIRDFIYQKHHK